MNSTKLLISRFAVAIIICLMGINKLHAQATWQKSYGTPTTDFPRQMIALTNGGYLFTGQSYTSVPGIYNIAYLAKVNANGDSVWTKEIYPTSPDSSIVGLSVFEINPNLFLLGCAQTLIMFDSSGNKVWYKTNLPSNYFEIFDFSNGEVVYSTGFELKKTDTSGTTVWSINFPHFFGTKRVLKNNRGNYCYLYPGTGGTYFREIAFNGQIIRDQLFGVGSSVSNGLLMQNTQLNYVEFHGGSNTNIVKFDTLLNILSEKIYSGFSQLRAFRETPDKGYILTGMDEGDIAFMKIDSNENQEYYHWLARWVYEEYPIDLHVDTDGGFVVFGSGERDAPNYTDFLLIKTNSDATLGVHLMSERKYYSLKIYTNPSNSKINIEANFPIKGILTISNPTGQIFLKQNIYEQSVVELNVENFTKGMYIIQIIDHVSYVPFYQKFIKE